MNPYESPQEVIPFPWAKAYFLLMAVIAVIELVLGFTSMDLDMYRGVLIMSGSIFALILSFIGFKYEL